MGGFRVTRCTKGSDRAQTGSQQGREARQASPTQAKQGETGVHHLRGGQADRSKCHLGGPSSYMGGQPRGGTKAPNLQVATLHRLHRPEQGLPQGSVPAATDRPHHRLYGWVRAHMFLGRLLRVPSLQEIYLLVTLDIGHRNGHELPFVTFL